MFAAIATIWAAINSIFSAVGKTADSLDTLADVSLIKAQTYRAEEIAKLEALAKTQPKPRASAKPK